MTNFLQGFGGQFGYHGLWLDYDYGHGHSKAQPKCTTYNSPQLSHQAEFSVDCIEVWAVGPKSRDELVKLMDILNIKQLSI